MALKAVWALSLRVEPGPALMLPSPLPRREEQMLVLASGFLASIRRLALAIARCSSDRDFPADLYREKTCWPPLQW
jgi:hypothetical protein